MKKCLVIGATMLDIIMKVDSLPKTGDDIYAKSQEMMIGGCAYNVADILKHLDIPYTLFAPIGNGFYGTIIGEKLEKSGHQSPLKVEQDNGYCICLVEKNGERTFLTLAGVECHFEKVWFHRLNVSEYDCVYVSGYEIEGEGGEAILEFLEENPQLTIYYGIGPRICHISKEKQERMAKLKPILHINEKECLEYTGCVDYREGAKRLWEQVQNDVFVTLGERGVYYFSEQDEMLVPSKKVKPIDTIGAGDSHIGGIIGTKKKGLSMKEVLVCANKISSIVVSVQGANVTREQLKEGGILYE